jgi:Rad3-related DNA helicase
MASNREIDQAFPYEDYRQLTPDATQYDVIEAVQTALDSGYETIYIDGPTGVGKSALNVACANLAESAFYTTPLKALRQQLIDDPGLQGSITGLRARRDYDCGKTDSNCEDCPINLDPERSCIQRQECTYWEAKREAMDSHTAALTFSFLIADGYLPTELSSGEQLSFSNRELLIVDEMDDLESQTASLFSGFTIGQTTLPDSVARGLSDQLDEEEMDTHDDVLDIVETIRERAQEYIFRNTGVESESKEVDQCKSFLRKSDWMLDEIDDGRVWVVDIETAYRSRRSEYIKTLQLSPVRVDRFLREHVWSRSDKQILSTATMPLRNDPRQLSARLGLDHDEAYTIKVSMPFPAKHRPVHKRYVGSFSGGGDTHHWPVIMDELNELAGIHDGQRGVVHTVSYSRGQKIRDTISNGDEDYPHLAGNTYQHNPGNDAEAVIDAWFNSDREILLSPAAMTGVDLYDDRCRWGVMLKAPYPHLGDSRLSYLIDEEDDWDYYNDIAARSIVQAAGRGVRHVEDYCDFYLLDEATEALLAKASFPEWFREAIVSNREPISLAKQSPIGWQEPDILDF